MYRKVRKKTPPSPTRSAVASVPSAASVAEKAPEPAVPKKRAAPKKAAPKKTSSKKKVAAKKTSSKKAAAAKTPKLKAIKWDEGMTQKALYRLAKDAGLKVLSKDWKEEIVRAIKKHNKKAAK